MTEKEPQEPTSDSDMSSSELDGVIHANKNLYDKLNQLPEIESLKDVIEEEDHQQDDKKEFQFIEKSLSKVSEFYSNNELVRYASWALILILISTSALTIIEYDMFKDSVIEDADGKTTWKYK